MAVQAIDLLDNLRLEDARRDHATGGTAERGGDVIVTAPPVVTRTMS
jgi:hypothetical protein